MILRRSGNTSMLAEERDCELDVSEFYFRLTTESIRLFSNKSLALCGLRQVIEDRASLAAELKDYYAADDMQEHLFVIPTDGDITLKFTILETSASSIDQAATILQEALGRSIEFADALSLIMYDFIVEEAKTEVLTKLGLSSEQAEKYRRILKRTPSNVIPFKR